MRSQGGLRRSRCPPGARLRARRGLACSAAASVCFAHLSSRACCHPLQAPQDTRVSQVQARQMHAAPAPPSQQRALHVLLACKRAAVTLLCASQSSRKPCTPLGVTYLILPVIVSALALLGALLGGHPAPCASASTATRCVGRPVCTLTAALRRRFARGGRGRRLLSAAGRLGGPACNRWLTMAGDCAPLAFRVRRHDCTVTMPVMLPPLRAELERLGLRLKVAWLESCEAHLRATHAGFDTMPLERQARG